jgi:hypothetical protein
MLAAMFRATPLDRKTRADILNRHWQRAGEG